MLGFINSDDTLKPGALDFAARHFQQGAKWVVGWVEFVEEGDCNFPQVWQDCERVGDWFVTNPIPQQGTFWTRDLWQQFGGFRDDLQLVFDYEFWMRLRFKARVTPKTVRRCMATYRLHPSSKTCSQTTLYTPENERVCAEYMKLLSAAELREVRKNRRARAVERTRVAGGRFKSADVPQARTYARQTLRLAPLWPESWRLAYCAGAGGRTHCGAGFPACTRCPSGPAVPAGMIGNNAERERPPQPALRFAGSKACTTIKACPRRKSNPRPPPAPTPG